MKQILHDSSVACINNAAAHLEQRPDALPQMLSLCQTEPYPISMRAARVIQFYAFKYPERILPHAAFLTETLLQTSVDGVKRSFLKIMIDVLSIEQIEKQGFVFNQCLNWLFSDKESIAVRAYCMDMLEKFASYAPELKSEVLMVLDNVTFDDSVGLSKRRLQCIKHLQKGNKL